VSNAITITRMCLLPLPSRKYITHLTVSSWSYWMDTCKHVLAFMCH